MMAFGGTAPLAAGSQTTRDPGSGMPAAAEGKTSEKYGVTAKSAVITLNVYLVM
jgi:hypothetical protein